MSSSVTVQEQRHTIWKRGTIASSVLCVAFFLLFLYLTDPFWIGIVRLCAFVSFAGTVLGFLNLRDGPLRVTLRTVDELLLVSYQKKGNVIQEEQFERATIKKVVPAKGNRGILLNYLQPGAVTFKVNFTDSDRDLHLFEFGGRPLLFDQSSQKKITNYLQELDIDCSSK